VRSTENSTTKLNFFLRVTPDRHHRFKQNRSLNKKLISMGESFRSYRQCGTLHCQSAKRIGEESLKCIWFIGNLFGMSLAVCVDEFNSIRLYITEQVSDG
jgi:hypothetical protein